MSRKSYVSALDEVLKPMGFTRQGREWSREVGTVLEFVGLQTSMFAGTTANLWSYDRALTDLLKEVLSSKPDYNMAIPATRIGDLMGERYDRWWKDDPNGPSEIAEALRAHAESFFERHRSLEDQARGFGRAEPRWKPSSTDTRMYLALTLYRMGELDEACRALKTPPKTAPPAWLTLAEEVRQWLGCPPRD